MIHCDNTDDKYELDPFLAKVLDKIHILHADNDQNVSTATDE